MVREEARARRVRKKKTLHFRIYTCSTLLIGPVPTQVCMTMYYAIICTQVPFLLPSPAFSEIIFYDISPTSLFLFPKTLCIISSSIPRSSSSSTCTVVSLRKDRAFVQIKTSLSTFSGLNRFLDFVWRRFWTEKARSEATLLAVVVSSYSRIARAPRFGAADSYQILVVTL